MEVIAADYLVKVAFAFNLIASAWMVQRVLVQLKGHATRPIYVWGVSTLMVEGVVALLSFLVVGDPERMIAGQPIAVWMLAAYAFANAQVFTWVIVFHFQRWSNAQSQAKA